MVRVVDNRTGKPAVHVDITLYTTMQDMAMGTDSMVLHADGKGIALMARRGYIRAGALTPGIFAFLVGIIQYPPTGIARVIAPFVLSLWFPGSALLVLGLVYWFLSTRRT